MSNCLKTCINAYTDYSINQVTCTKQPGYYILFPQRSPGGLIYAHIFRSDSPFLMGVG